ncbi:MAG TPA: PDZ domain-containing protein [Actinomycetota bacterium]|nr:PDZ domain-containing protein [Actinomycetota bacterium]
MTEDTLNIGYFRSASIAGERVVFLCEDDVWTVARDGGIARRLTSNLGPVGRTIVSPGGEYIAFTGTEEAHAEVYVMPADGGSAHRRTHLGAASAVRGWTRDGRVAFVSDARSANRGDTMMWAVDPVAGQPEMLSFGTATELAYAPDGKGVVIGRHTVDPARWKRYRGGTRGDVWIDTEGRGSFKRLLSTFDGNIGSPLWVGARIYFLSDHEGIGNLYSCTPSGRDVRRHTDHDAYYARWASSDGARIVYQLAADIWIYDPETDTSRRIDIDFRSPRVFRNRRFVESAKYLHSWRVHPDGHALAANARGKLHTMPLWEQAVRQYGRRDGVRYRLAQWTFDGASVVCVSDEGGEEALEVFSTKDGSRTKRLERIDIGRPIELQASPTRNEVVVANHRNELIWVNLQTNRSKLLDRSEYGRITGPVCSPDGRYVAYSCAETQRTTSIKLADVGDGTTRLLTRPEFVDFHPSFDPDGRFLYFLSRRVFDPVYDMLYFSIGFPRSVRPHLITLRADEPSPFVAKPRGFGEQRKRDDPPNAAAKKPTARKGGPVPKAPPVKPIRIDVDGIADRVVAFPMPEGRYTQVWGIRNKVLFTSVPVSGTLQQDWFDVDEQPKGKIDVYDLNELKLDMIVGGVTGFRVSADGSTLVYQAGRRLRALRAGEKPDVKNEHEPPGRRSGWIDTGRIRVSVHPPTEWRQMYREAWRFQREHFWVADMSGVDWDAIYERYLPLVDKVASRLEFSDLMWEMLGELGTSHAYEIGGDVRPPPPYRVGQLGCDLSLRNARWVVDHIVRGDSWDPRLSSPLAAPGINVKEGSTILAVNGQATAEDVSPQSLLVHQAGIDVELVVGDARGRNPRTVVVRTLADERPLRYREWVETNRALVHERTNGRVGYVHIPDMGPPGFAEFHRYYLSEVERDALIVDVRFNGGGHVSQLIIEKLARERLGYDVTRWGRPDPYPSDSPAGPLVCLTNELAASDGDIFTHVFKLKKLGPVVGKRTWGGVVGINMRHVLVDNGVTTQPEFSFWFRDVGWGVENYGTDPTHDVDITPQDYAKGRDPQMETGLKLALDALKRHKPLAPDMRTRPHLALPVLPPRGRKAVKRKPAKRKPTRRPKR